jgi:hypothetical protein
VHFELTNEQASSDSNSPHVLTVFGFVQAKVWLYCQQVCGTRRAPVGIVVAELRHTDSPVGDVLQGAESTQVLEFGTYEQDPDEWVWAIDWLPAMKNKIRISQDEIVSLEVIMVFLVVCLRQFQALHMYLPIG